MSITAEEIAALGRGVGHVSAGLANGVDMDHRHYAADVLTWLVNEGTCPDLFMHQHTTRCDVSGDKLGEAPTWPLAVLRAAAAYQLAKESA